MKTDRPARLLTRHFFHALFDFGVFTQDGADAFVRVVLGLISLLICLGLLLLRFYAGKYAALFHGVSGEPYLQAVLADSTLAIALPMWAIAVVTVLVGQSLFPDETDFRVLMPLPIGRGVVFGAKLLALARFAGVFTVTSHLALTPLVMLIAGGPWSVTGRPLGILAFWAVSVPASAFAVLAVVAVNGVILLCVPRQSVHGALAAMRSVMLGVLVLILPLVMALPAQSVRLARESRLMFLAPPAWFMGLDRWLLGYGGEYFVQLAQLAAAAFTSAALISGGSYLILYRRFDRVMLHAFSTPRRRHGHRRIVGNPARAAVRDFTAATLHRSALHQGVVVGLSACGVALAVNILLRYGVVSWLRGIAVPHRELLGAVAAIPFPLIIVLGAAARASLALPVEPKANWVFRITERDAIRGDELHAAERMLTLFSAMIPAALTLPFQWMVAGPRALLASGMTAAFGLLWAEALLRDWRRIPFTCSYMPGKHSVAQSSLAGVCLFLVASTVGGAMELSSLRATALAPRIIIVSVLAAIVFVLRRRRRAGWERMPLTFDEELPSDVHVLSLARD